MLWIMTNGSSHFVGCQWSLKVCCPSSSYILCLCLNAENIQHIKKTTKLSNQPLPSSSPPAAAVSRLWHTSLCVTPSHPSHIRRSKTNLSTPQVEPEAGTFPPSFLPSFLGTVGTRSHRSGDLLHHEWQREREKLWQKGRLTSVLRSLSRLNETRANSSCLSSVQLPVDARAESANGSLDVRFWTLAVGKVNENSKILFVRLWVMRLKFFCVFSFMGGMCKAGYKLCWTVSNWLYMHRWRHENVAYGVRSRRQHTEVQTLSGFYWSTDVGGDSSCWTVRRPPCISNTVDFYFKTAAPIPELTGSEQKLTDVSLMMIIFGLLLFLQRWPQPIICLLITISSASCCLSCPHSLRLSLVFLSTFCPPVPTSWYWTKTMYTHIR